MVQSYALRTYFKAPFSLSIHCYSASWLGVYWKSKESLLSPISCTQEAPNNCQFHESSTAIFCRSAAAALVRVAAENNTASAVTSIAVAGSGFPPTVAAVIRFPVK